ncbi:hypothetical protein R1sor_002216 [Riccia sorocarpa]|uniref:Uncharacterized protein n=1 Tax=Riccia sorocarpa TaxID=122646 RepID=A0ABD3H0V3_9MARC
MSDRKYLEHLDFFIEAKACRFFRPKKGQRRTILLSSLRGLDEELEAVQKYIFWKRRTPRVKKLTPKAILMVPKSAKKKDKIPAKSHAQTPSQSPAKTTPMAPSSSSTPSKVGVCKSLALPIIALKEYRGQLEELGLGFLFWRWDFSEETLVKEFATAKSEVARLTMPEGVNLEELFSEKRPEKDKNGYKTRSYKDPFKKVLAESLMALFCPAHMMYLVTHKVAFIERVVKGKKMNWGAVFAQHVLHSLKTVNDGNPVYVGAFLSSDEDDTYSDEEQQAAAPQVLAKDTEDEDEDEDECTPRPRGVHFSFEDAIRKPKSHTSPNYSPQATPEPKTKKRMQGEVTRTKRTLRTGLEDTTKNCEENEDEDQDQDQDKGKQPLEEGVEVEIQEGEPARLTSPSPSCAMTAENLTKYLMPTFSVIEEEGRLMYRKFEVGPDHLNTATEIIRRARIFGENMATEMKLRTALRKQKEQVKKGNETIEEHEDTIDELEKDKKELQDMVKTKDERLKKLESEFEALKIAETAQDEELKVKDTKITNLQVQWIERREVEEKEAAIGSFRDSLKEIYETMKAEYPSKEEKKSRLMQLADRTKGNYEGILREYRDDFGEFKRRLLSKTDAPTTSGRSS